MLNTVVIYQINRDPLLFFFFLFLIILNQVPDVYLGNACDRGGQTKKCQGLTLGYQLELFSDLNFLSPLEYLQIMDRIQFRYFADSVLSLNNPFKIIYFKLLKI